MDCKHKGMKRKYLPAVLLVFTLWLPEYLTAGTQADPKPFDLLIENGRVIDGTGSPWYSADIAVKDGRIAAIGRFGEADADRTIDAAGKVVAPGFIDMLGWSDLTILVDPRVPSKIFQGITTEITGEGISVAPLNDAIIEESRNEYDLLRIEPDWRTLDGYFARLERQGIGLNFATYVGATQVRKMVLGYENRKATEAELAEMQALVAAAMRRGARGISTSLQYAPAMYAGTEELIALASVAAAHGGLYATHMRSEAAGVMEAIDEAVRIGREARIPVEIWHLKAAGASNFGRMPEIVAKIQKARDEGVDVSANTYAYTAWFNSLSAFVPPWAHEGGNEKLLERLDDPETRERIRAEMEQPGVEWDNMWQNMKGPEAVLIGAVQNPDLAPLQGKNLAEIAEMRGQDPLEAMLDVLVEDEAYTMGAIFGMSEPDVALALAQPWVSVVNDSNGTSPEGILGSFHPHPRAYGTFPRILRKYVREEGLLSLEEAIRKFSALPAQKMGLADRGVLKQGMWADIVVFDPGTIRDLSTFSEPNRFSVGMEWVVVNGVPVIANGEMTGALPGQVLRGPGYRPEAAQ